MKRVSKLLILAILFGASPVIFSQSLGAVAKKEKKRREELRKSGQTGLVLSEKDLTRDEDEQDTQPSVSSETAPSERNKGSALETQITLDTVIQPDAPLAEKNRVFDRMKQLYEEQVENIDLMIRTNELRLTEIERELSAIGAGGLPVVTTATQATTPTSGFEFKPLMDERKKLTEQNEQLVEQKASLKESLLGKGRRGGIAAGRLRF